MSFAGPPPLPGPQPHGPGGYGAAPPHPDARTALVIGIVALGGAFFCLLPIVAAPWAWAKGARAVREIDASQGRLGGRDDAQAGMVMGIIGTVLLGLGLLFVLLVVVLFVVLGAGMLAVFSETGGGNV